MAVQWIEGRLSALVKISDNTKRELEMVRKYRTRLIADVVTGKFDVREAVAELPEVDSLTAEGDPDDSSNPEVRSDSDQYGVTGQEADG